MIDVGDYDFVGQVPADAAIDTQLGQILNADRDAVFAVHNEQGETIGALTRQIVVDLLVTSPQKA
jgi:hypothetical protein